MRYPLAGLALVFSACASAPPVVVPAGGAPNVTAAAGPATITVAAGAWDGDPADLAEYVTPIPVQLYNAGPGEVRVSYIDFVLTDESGNRYAALNPYVTAANTTSAREDASELRLASWVDDEPPPMAGTLVAWRGGGGGGHGSVHIGGGGYRGSVRGGGGYRYGGVRGGGGFRSGGYRYGGGYRFGGPISPRRFGGGVYLGGGLGWRGYSPLPWYRPWFGVGLGYWASPWLYPPGYSTWVWGWGPSTYPTATPPGDVLSAGVPEGVLQPGGAVDGFLYFQRPASGARTLTLTWEPREARSDQPLGQARVQLDVVAQ